MLHWSAVFLVLFLPDVQGVRSARFVRPQAIAHGVLLIQQPTPSYPEVRVCAETRACRCKNKRFYYRDGNHNRRKNHLQTFSRRKHTCVLHY